MNPSHGYSEGAEVPEDKTPKRVRTKGRKMTKDERWLLYTQAARMQERDKAIDDCIALVFQEDGDFQHFKSPATVKQELESLKNNMTMNTKDRIEKEAIKYVIQETGYQVLPEHDHWKKAYIAGATAERNKAIDACINYMKENPIGLDAIDEQYIEEFESLKNKPI